MIMFHIFQHQLLNLRFYLVCSIQKVLMSVMFRQIRVISERMKQEFQLIVTK